jgi:hypothetical protein
MAAKKKAKGVAWRNPAIPALEVNKFLHSEIASNTEKGILRSENAVMGRLLEADLQSAWSSLLQQIPDPGQWRVVVSRIVTVSAFLSPGRMREAREAKRDLEELRGEISKAAEELARLIERRSALASKWAFDAGDSADVIDLIRKAAAESKDAWLPGLFPQYIEPSLERLRSRYDDKYWPSLPAIIRALANEAKNAHVEILDEHIRSALSSREHSIADYFRSLFHDFDELRSMSNSYPFPLPPFQFSDRDLAAIAKAALGVPVTAGQAKKARQRA